MWILIFFHSSRLVNIHLILGHVQETQADWFHSKKCKKSIIVMDTKIYTIDCHNIINMLKENLLKFHASFQLYDKKLTKSTFINYPPKYMSLVCIPSSVYFLMPLIPGNGFRAVKPIFLNSKMILISHFSICFSSN